MNAVHAVRAWSTQLPLPDVPVPALTPVRRTVRAHRRDVATLAHLPHHPARGSGGRPLKLPAVRFPPYPPNQPNRKYSPNTPKSSKSSRQPPRTKDVPEAARVPQKSEGFRTVPNRPEGRTRRPAAADRRPRPAAAPMDTPRDHTRPPQPTRQGRARARQARGRARNGAERFRPPVPARPHPHHTFGGSPSIGRPSTPGRRCHGNGPPGGR